MTGDLPEAVLRFEPRVVESGLLDAAKIGQVQRCVVVLDGEDVAELEISNLRYEQDGAMPGRWSVSLFADPEDPLRRTMRFAGPWPWDRTPISDLELSGMTVNALARSGISTVQDLINMTDQALLGISSIGRKGLADIHAALAARGL